MLPFANISSTYAQWGGQLYPGNCYYTQNDVKYMLMMTLVLGGSNKCNPLNVLLYIEYKCIDTSCAVHIYVHLFEVASIMHITIIICQYCSNNTSQLHAMEYFDIC